MPDLIVDALRDLPSVDELLRELHDSSAPSSLLKQTIRLVLQERRSAIIAGDRSFDLSVSDAVRERLLALGTPSLRPVINATGVILHTNLGRAPLLRSQVIEGYSNLEYDLQTGKRGKRDSHTSSLLQALLNRPAIVVNNNAAAVLLVLNELAAGSEVIVSRGELIEIGDGFRIPEIMTRAGVVLREVGTTNRTHLRDYEAAINANTRLILRVHPSNFHISGFTAMPDLQDLCTLGAEHGIPVYEDLGSGCLVDLKAYGVQEPLVQSSFAAGASLVSFSCDKLLSGPQSGIIAGTPDLVTKIRKNPLYRALRIDKLVVAALETSLRHLLFEQWSAIPALHMIQTSGSTLKDRAQSILDRLQGVDARLEPAQSPIGGGSTPNQTLPTWQIILKPTDPVGFERALRKAQPPVIGRVHQGRIILDMRTVSDAEIPALVSAVQSAFRPESQAS